MKLFKAEKTHKFKGKGMLKAASPAGFIWRHSKGLISSAVLVREDLQQQNSERGYNTKALD